VIVRRRLAALGAAASTIVVAALLAPGCLSGEQLGETDIECPSAIGFRDVSQVLERRCGTLDCHGDPSRPFRIYGRTGLRRPETEQSYLEGLPEGALGDFSEYRTGGTEPTSDREVAANRLAACGVEPELMMSVVQGDAEPGELTLVRKPRLTEAHKGGFVWKEGIAGDKCLVSWIQGTIDATACIAELKRP
jgi:hypothetical protein